MKKINLSKNMVALVDDEDYEFLNRYKWNANTAYNKNYAVRRYGIKEGGDGRLISMHRVIMGDSANGLDVDHIDGDGLNNQKKNLRVCTRAENLRNRKKPQLNDEPYTGIKKYNGILKTTWRAIIGHDGITEHLGMFSTPEEAAMEYDKAAKKYFGEFARLNFPENRTK